MASSGDVSVDDVIGAGIQWLDADEDGKRAAWERFYGMLHNYRADSVMGSIRVAIDSDSYTDEVAERIGADLRARFPMADVCVWEAEAWLECHIHATGERHTMWCHTKGGGRAYCDRDEDAIRSIIETHMKAKEDTP